jgi:hypothetical protein
VSELFFFFLYKWNWACSDKFLLFVIMNQNEFYLFSFQCWVGIWSLLIKEGLRVFFFFFFCWKSGIVETTGSKYFKKPIFSFFDNYEYSGLAFKFGMAPCVLYLLPKGCSKNLPFTLNTLHKFFLSFTKNTTNKHELGVIFISCSHNVTD